MHDPSKTNQTLIKENSLLKERIQELELSKVESKRAEEALRESEKQFRAIANYTPDLENWVGPDGKLIWINPQVYDLTGYSVEECMNMHDYPAPVVHEEDRERIMRTFNSSVQGAILKNVEFRIRCKDGSIKWTEVSSQPVYDENGVNLGHRASVRDITSRKRAEEALRNSEERFRQLADATFEGILIHKKGVIIDVNKSLLKMSGYDYEEVIGQNLITFVAAESREDVLRRMKSNFDMPFEASMTIKDRTTRIVEVIGKVITYEGRRATVVAIRDITERKQAEEELTKHRESLEILVRERTAELENERTNLEELNTALKVLLRQREKDKDELEEKILANVKELVMPYIQRLRKSPLKSKEADYVNILESNLKEIVSPFSHKLSSKYLNLTPTEIQIANLIKEGKTSKEIGELLHVSPGTIAFHRTNIRIKLNVKNKKDNLRSYLVTL